jgi:hypothetical protein
MKSGGSNVMMKVMGQLILCEWHSQGYDHTLSCCVCCDQAGSDMMVTFTVLSRHFSFLQWVCFLMDKRFVFNWSDLLLLLLVCRENQESQKWKLSTMGTWNPPGFTKAHTGKLGKDRRGRIVQTSCRTTACCWNRLTSVSQSAAATMLSTSTQLPGSKSSWQGNKRFQFLCMLSCNPSLSQSRDGQVVNGVWEKVNNSHVGISHQHSPWSIFPLWAIVTSQHIVFHNGIIFSLFLLDEFKGSQLTYMCYYCLCKTFILVQGMNMRTILCLNYLHLC